MSPSVTSSPSTRLSRPRWLPGSPPSPGPTTRAVRWPMRAQRSRRWSASVSSRRPAARCTSSRTVPALSSHSPRCAPTGSSRHGRQRAVGRSSSAHRSTDRGSSPRTAPALPSSCALLALLDRTSTPQRRRAAPGRMAGAARRRSPRPAGPRVAARARPRRLGAVQRHPRPGDEHDLWHRRQAVPGKRRRRRPRAAPGTPHPGRIPCHRRAREPALRPGRHGGRRRPARRAGTGRPVDRRADELHRDRAHSRPHGHAAARRIADDLVRAAWGGETPRPGARCCR